MKLSWLVPALLVGGGAAVASDKVLVNGNVILKSKPALGLTSSSLGS